jgi:hypothetical protein
MAMRDGAPRHEGDDCDWVRWIRDQHIHFSYELQREGATTVEGEGTTKKFTHTWLKTNGTWRIIGGMCGADAPR